MDRVEPPYNRLPPPPPPPPPSFSRSIEEVRPGVVRIYLNSPGDNILWSLNYIVRNIASRSMAEDPEKLEAEIEDYYRYLKRILSVYDQYVKAVDEIYKRIAGKAQYVEIYEVNEEGEPEPLYLTPEEWRDITMRKLMDERKAVNDMIEREFSNLKRILNRGNLYL